MIELVNININFFNKASPQLKNNLEFCKISLLKNCIIYSNIPREILINLSDKLDIVKKLTIECYYDDYFKLYDIDNEKKELIKEFNLKSAFNPKNYFKKK